MLRVRDDRAKDVGAYSMYEFLRQYNFPSMIALQTWDGDIQHQENISGKYQALAYSMYESLHQHNSPSIITLHMWDGETNIKKISL